MLLEINKNVWVNVDQISMLKLEEGQEPAGYFKMINDNKIYPLTSLEYNYVVLALNMFARRKIVGEE